MKLIQRYFFRQLLGPTLTAAVALAGVVLLSNSLSVLDVIVEQRQTALVFARLTLLGVPMLLSLILPIALFVAALVALNRLHTDQEIVVCFASGMTRWSVITPAVRLTTVVALVILSINLFVQPYSQRLMREQLHAVRTDLAATLVREGEFTSPAPGLTVYAQRVEQDGRLANVFIQKDLSGGATETFTAEQAQIVTRGPAPALIMRNGSTQSFSSDGVLNFLEFDENVFDLAPFLNTDDKLHYKISDRYLHELVFPDLRHDWERWNRSKMLAEAHYRLSAPLYAFAFMGIALAAVLGGAYSRLGYGRRIAAGAAVAVVVRIVGFGAQSACDDAPVLNVLQYAIPAGVAWFAFRRIFRQKAHIRLAGRAGGPQFVEVGA